MQPFKRNVKRIFLTLLVIGSVSCGGGSSESSDSPDETPSVPTDVASLQSIDTEAGTGPTAVIGRELTVNYVGSIYDAEAEDFHGQVFDRTSGTPFTFTLGAGEVIDGWDQGVPGMKEGGTRTLIIPSRLAYGRQGSGPIPPNTAVVFDIQLLSVD